MEFWDGGVFCNFGFGLRGKTLEIWILGGYSATSDLDLGGKSWKFGFFGMGGYSATLDLDLGGKSWKFGFFGMGGYSATSDLDLGEKLWKFGFWGGILQLRIWT